MDWNLIAYLGIFGALACGALILFARWIWREAERRIPILVDKALARPVPTIVRDWDAEMRELVLEEHNRDE